MENAGRELVSVLLGHIRSLGLISDSTYDRAVDLVHSGTELPNFFRYPAGLTTEEGEHEHTQNTK